ncbi:MAG TPA: aminotransferase class IV [Tepidisphaeraceae bacterium]|jgi:branched-chain amino acid aminotransferase|nr:aminotransferase class IV [Tepidisphaeraceae bacterium]
MLQNYNPANANLIVNVNGQLVHRDKAGVSPFDSAVQNGDAVWEGLRLYNGQIFRLQQHLARLRKSASMLQYESYPTDEYLVDQLRHTLAANQMTDGVHIRLTISRGVKYTSGLDPRINTCGCSMFILPEFKPPVYDKKGITLITAKIRRPLANVLDQHIHSSNQLTSILAKLEANAAGADDSLMLDVDGFLAETDATHVFIVKNGVVETSTTRACPEGITRAAVLELCEKNKIPHRVRDITPQEIAAADEVFCTGTMGELAPVIRVDQITYNDGKPGEICQKLSTLFRQLTDDPSQSEVMV